MRTITTDTQSRIDALTGEEPVVVLELTLGDTTYLLSDRVMSNIATDDRLSEIGPLQAQARIDNADRWVGSVSIMSFSIIDDDEFFLGLLGSNAMQGSDAVVYLAFDGQSKSDWTVLLRGRIEEAPEWDEDDHSLRIEVETPRRLDEVPTTPEASDSLVDEEFEGQTWPMIFGDGVRDVRAQQVTSVPTSQTVEDFDQTETFSFIVADADDDFPQNEQITLLVGEELISGEFDGEEFLITNRQENRHDNFAATGNGAIIRLPAGYRAVGAYIQVSKDPFGSTTERAIFTGFCFKQIGRDAYIWNGNANFIIDPSWSCRINRYPYTPAQGAQWTHKAGTQVTQWGIPVTYVVSEVPMTEVRRISAFRQVTNEEGTYSRNQLVNVDPDLYTVDLSDDDYNGATTVTLTNGLLSSRGAGWSDDLYCSGISSVGSNTADIIEWLVEEKTEFTVDATSFTTVRNLLEKYPMNFGVTTSKDVLTLISEIAWQNRCGVTWNGDSVVLTYLSAEPDTYALSLIDDNIAEGGIVETATPITDLTTVFIAEWRKNGEDQEPRRITYKNNIDKYGRRQQVYEFWAFQKRSLVAKSASFWANRYSKSWRTVKTTMFGLEALAVDPFDYCAWNATGFYPGATGLTFKNNVSPDGHGTIELQLNVEVGTSTPDEDYFQDDSGDATVTSPTIRQGTTEIEIMVVGAPDAIASPNQPRDTFAVVAVENEENNPNSSAFKQVRVRIKSEDEIETQADLTANLSRIAEIDTLDPSGTNGTLQSEKSDLETANSGLTDTLNLLDNYGDEVIAINGSISFMLTGDTGTMIKVPGGAYYVTPDNASGPLIATITKKPESPAEGNFYADIAGTQATQIGTGTREIEILGDGSAIEVGDKLQVFRDSDGTWYASAPAAAGDSSFFNATSTGSKPSEPGTKVYAEYETVDEEGDPVTETIQVEILNMDEDATFPADVILRVWQEGSTYYAQVPLWL